MSKTTDLAYLAGFLDGEGCISGTTGGRYKEGRSRPYYTRVVIGQKDPTPLLWIQRRFGGRVFEQKRKPPYTSSFRWILNKQEDIEALLPLIIPYLIVKREQAIVGHKLASRPYTFEEQKKLSDQLKQLKHKGAQIGTCST